MNDYSRFKDIHTQLANTGFKENIITVAIEDNRRTLDIGKPNGLANMSACAKCKMQCKNKVPGFGPINSPLMIIGEGPGRDELSTGIPFMGPAGTLLIMTLNCLGVRRDNIYLTNATHCNRMDNNKYLTPDINEIAACRNFLVDEINMIQPKVIIVLGNPALRSVMNDYRLKISKERGKTLLLDGGPTIVLPTWHPSYVIRQKGYEFTQAKTEFWDDMRHAIQMVQIHAPNYKYQ